MRADRHVREWGQALAGLLGLLLALPLFYLMVLEWLAVVRLGGWFSYAMVAWAVLFVAWLPLYVLAPIAERRHSIRLGKHIARDLEDS